MIRANQLKKSPPPIWAAAREEAAWSRGGEEEGGCEEANISAGGKTACLLLLTYCNNRRFPHTSVEKETKLDEAMSEHVCHEPPAAAAAAAARFTIRARGKEEGGFRVFSTHITRKNSRTSN